MSKKKNTLPTGRQEKIEETELDDKELENVDADELWDEVESEIEEEGQLSVDVYQDKNYVIIKSTIAGVEPEDIDISVDNDMITLRGRREQDRTIKEDDYFYQECYWGSFSRSIILPVEIVADKIDATIKNGILTVKLPKAKKNEINIKVKDEN